MVHVTEGLDIPDGELVFTTSRSSGPGGQNVNKVNTRVTLLFDVEKAPSLSARQRTLLRERLPGRISKDGILRVVSQRHRTQMANREAVVQRFADLLRDALVEAPARIPVALPGAVNEKRLQEKRRRSRIKRERAVDRDLDD
ncbi:MAG: alternative ribosome rescue aminoacyl-tRNA hydrolase ArfB [bacterium]